VRLLIKIGGTLLDEAGSRKTLARQIAARHADGAAMVVVHGGGKQMTRFLAERGVESRFIGGLRVTTPDVVDALLKVFTGSVNKELVASLVAAGATAAGVSGIDGALAQAEQLSPELGQVGRIVNVNPRLLDVLVAGGMLPVVACVACDVAGTVYNVNADQMAVTCAVGWKADRLLFLTDVDGVRGADGETIGQLTSRQARELIDDGIATGGMQAKLDAACDALIRGVGEVIIAPGAAENVLKRLASGESLGTRLMGAET